jgi:hypothetical protein
LVVRSTEDPHSIVRVSALRDRHDVVDLEEPGLLAPPPIVGDERALRAVPRHRLTPRRARYVPPALAPLRRPRLLHLTELPRLDLLQQRIQRAIQDHGQIARRHLVTQQGLRPQ